LPEPKQKAKATIKNARLTEPAWIMLEKCHHETTHRSQEEPCKFCGKAFPTWKKLTAHLAKHMEHISLPILRLVEARSVDANMIISPVEKIISPVTPIGVPKMETSPNSFNIIVVYPHIPSGNQFASTGYEQAPYFSITGSNGYDGIMNYQPNNVYSNQYMQPPVGFGLRETNINAMNNTRTLTLTPYSSLEDNGRQAKRPRASKPKVKSGTLHLYLPKQDNTDLQSIGCITCKVSLVLTNLDNRRHYILTALLDP
jgi:hypothetical protein